MTTETQRELLRAIDAGTLRDLGNTGVAEVAELAGLLAELVRWREDNRGVTNPEIALLHGGRSDLASLHRHVVWGEHPDTDPAPAPRGPSWDDMRRPVPSPEAIARHEAADRDDGRKTNRHGFPTAVPDALPADTVLDPPFLGGPPRAGRILTDAEREGPQR